MGEVRRKPARHPFSLRVGGIQVGGPGVWCMDRAVGDSGRVRVGGGKGEGMGCKIG